MKLTVLIVLLVIGSLYALPDSTCPKILRDIQNLTLRGERTSERFIDVDTKELTGDFTFFLDGLTINNAPGVTALLSNSRADTPGCELPTFEVVADTYQRTVSATVVTVEPTTTTLSAPLPTNGKFKIRVERRGKGLILHVNKKLATASTSLGTYSVDQTSCSLDIGNSRGRDSLQGTIKRVTLTREC